MTNLVKISKLLKKQNITAEEQNITITAKKLKEYINYVIKTKKTYNSGGIKIEWINEKNVVDVEVKGTINGDLNIRGTKVRKIKAKQIKGGINAKGVKTLKEINVEEETEGYLDIRGTSVEFQRDIIDKINEKKLKIKGYAIFGGAIKGINQLCNNKNLTIPGDLDIRGTKVRKINLKYIRGGINAKGVKTLKEINVEEEIDGESNIRGTEVKRGRKRLIIGKIGDLNIRGTRVKKIKAKKIKGNILAEGVKTLKEIDVPEGIGGDLNIKGTSVKKISTKIVGGDIDAEQAKELEEINVEEKIHGDLNIIGTIVKTIKANKIGRSVFATGVETLKEINVEEGIEGGIDIRGTKVKEIKTRAIRGYINAEGVETLEEINVKTVIMWGLDIRGTKVRKIKAKNVGGNINATGVETLEEIDAKEIEGNLNIKGTKIGFQKKILEKIRNGKLKINGEILYDKEIINNLKDKKTTEEQNKTINADDLIKYIKNVEETKKDYNTDGIEIKWIDEKNVVDVNVEGIINGYLNIKGTNIRKIKAKKVLGDINAYGVETLEEIDVTEGIEGRLNIIFTKIDFQKKILEKIGNGELDINGKIFYNDEAIGTLNIIIDAKDLIKYIDYVKKTKTTYNKGGIKIEWISKKNVVDVDIQRIINGDLNIERAKVRKIKAKKVLGNINAEGAETLEEINVEEKIIGNLDIRGTSVKTIKAKWVWGGIFAKRVNTLEEIEITEGIDRYLDIEGTSVKKISTKYVGGSIKAKGVKTLEEINVEEKIDGNLYIEGTSVKKISIPKINGSIFAKEEEELKKLEKKELKELEELEKLEELEEIEIKEWIAGDLNIIGTKVKKIEAGYIGGSIKAKGVKTLEEINVEEEIVGNLDIIGTNVRKIKAKAILRNVYAEGVETLKEMNVEKILGNLDIRGTNKNFQKEILEKIRNGKLEINGEILYDDKILNTLKDYKTTDSLKTVAMRENSDKAINILKDNRITEKQNIIIDTDDLIKYIDYVKERKTTYNKGGIKIEWISKKNVVDIDIEGIINGYLNIEGTNIRKIKAKQILGGINATGVKTLEEIEVEKGIDGDLDIIGTNVRKIKAKQIWGYINATGVKTLEEIEVGGINVEKGIKGTMFSAFNVPKIFIEGIEGDLNIEGTNVRKIKAKQIWGYINAKGVKTLEEIDAKEIEGNLDIRGTSVEFQKKIINKIIEKKLKILGKIYFGGAAEGIEKLCNDKNLTIPGHLDIRGTKVRKINLKHIMGDINATGVKTLEEINVEEKIEGHLDIRGTKVRKINTQKIGEGIFATGVETLEEIDIPVILGDLNIIGTSVKKIKTAFIGGNIKAEGVKTLEEINVEEGIEGGIEGGLNIRGTRVKKIKAKKIKGNILAEGVTTLEEINIPEGIDGYLNIKGTSVKKISTEFVWGNINAEQAKELEEIEITEGIDGYLNIKGTKVKKIKAKWVWGSIFAEQVTTLEEIDVKGIINGNVDIRGTNVDFQKKVLKKKKNGQLKIKGELFSNI